MAQHLSNNGIPSGPHLVVKALSHVSQRAAIASANRQAAVTMRRPVEELHQSLEQGSFQVDGYYSSDCAPSGVYEVEMHYRVLT